MTKLSDLASTIRSKNAGVNQITFDIIFSDAATYRRVLASNAITRETIAKLYRIPDARISDFVTFGVANAIKFTLGPLREQACTPDRAQRDEEMAAALVRAEAGPRTGPELTPALDHRAIRAPGAGVCGVRRRPSGPAVDVGGDGSGSMANSITITVEPAFRCARSGLPARLLGPACFLLIGAFGLVVMARRYQRCARSEPSTAERMDLTPVEAARLAEILRRSDG